MFAREQALWKRLGYIRHGVRSGDRSEIPFHGNRKKRRKLSRKRDLFRFVGVICTNQFKISTGSHNIDFTFISFLKRKRKNENVPPIAIWCLVRNPRKESLPWNSWPCCLDSKSFLHNYIKLTKQKIRGIKREKNVWMQNLQLNVFGKIDVKLSHRAIYTWINVTTKNRT